MADGYTMLVTWPQMAEGQHVQETWYAHIAGQTEAVRAVEEACGALNDAKIEILGPLQHESLTECGVPEGAVIKSR